MNIDNLTQFLVTFLASIGGAGIVVVGLATWIGKIWENYISLKIATQQAKELETLKNRYEVELEKLRGELERQRTILDNVSSGISAGYMATHPHIVEAIKSLWAYILEIGKLSATYFLIHDLLTGEQIERLTPEYAAKQIHMSQDKLNEKVVELSEKSEIVRPFVGEKLWSLYHVYRAFVLRICAKMHFTQNKSGNLYGWNKDEHGRPDTSLLDMLKIVLTEKEIKQITEIKTGAPSQVLNLLKSKILSEMNELVLGKRMISLSIDEQQNIANLIYISKPDSNKPDE